ncbi:vWA domain-containing protein [Delftia sp. JD2]|jgi:hypothetical protein|uniref:vWA domain-containing protein n=1 Tax=Delftia sp. JD2 TaxID=469553 RepID=UPI000806C667|nr:vWA domain-containing protein [Delftia sp. JD2]OBY87037.1 hypothetical protein ACM14_02590 [Delftia sp. JD2]
MTRQLVNPLQSLIGKAKASLPQHTGTVAKAHDRMTRLGSGQTVVLADVSGSMDSLAWGGRSKHSLLGEAIAATAAGHEVLAFAEDVTPVPNASSLPPASGSTALHLALNAARERNPGRILVISDGEPDDEVAALAAAKAFPGVIDVLYIGPDSNAAAMRFLRSLAQAGHGRYEGSDIARAGQPALAHTVQRLIGRSA